MKILTAALVLLGALPRLSQFLSGRALWLDEVQLAGNYLERSYGELFGPLSYNQVAPALYLVTQKTALTLLGLNVYALRLTSLICAILMLILVWPTVRRIASPLSTTVAMAFIAVSQHLIYYAGEAKPYACDAFFTILLLYLALKVEERKDSKRWLLALAVAGIIAVWFCYPAVFLLAGYGLTQILSAAIRKQHRSCVNLLLVYGVSACSFALHYLLVMRPVRLATQSLGYMDSYWRHGFLPSPAKDFLNLGWFKARALLFADMPGGFSSAYPLLTLLLGWLALLVALIGLGALFFRKKEHAFMVIGPFIFALLASGIHAYPFHHRMTLFLAPLFFIALGEGIATMGNSKGVIPKVCGLMILAILVGLPAVRAARTTILPSRHHELERALAYADENWEADDLLYVGFPDSMAYTFLKGRYHFPESRVILGEYIADQDQATPQKVLGDLLPQLRGANRVWITMSYDDPGIFAPWLDVLKAEGDMRNFQKFRGASVYAFKLKNGPVDRASSLP
jgi:uncharacterized membrane protein